MEEHSNISGILVVDKPDGLTSRDVVNRVSKILKTKKVGHTGTLDPIATGVLILTIGKCTKLGELLTSEYKEYEATFILGYETDTLDNTGTITKSSDKIASTSEIENCIMSFKGKYLQEVPLYSAVKVNGKRLYEYARAGIKVDLPKREVDIKDIEIMTIEQNEIKIRTIVSKGTYIRSLIRDIGESLGTYATMTNLQRTSQGNIRIEDAYTLEDIERGNFKILSPQEILKDIEKHNLDSDSYKKVINGMKMHVDSESEYIAFMYENELIALYQRVDETYKMYLKFV